MDFGNEILFYYVGFCFKDELGSSLSFPSRQNNLPVIILFLSVHWHSWFGLLSIWNWDASSSDTCFYRTSCMIALSSLWKSLTELWFLWYKNRNVSTPQSFLSLLAIWTSSVLFRQKELRLGWILFWGCISRKR